MLNRHPNLFLSLALLGTLSLGSIQGQRVDHLRDSELFYRWIISAATQIWVHEGRLTGYDDGTSKFKDKELFTAIVERVEGEFPETALMDDDFDENGDPLPQLVRVVRDQLYDDILWDLANGPLLASERTDFLQYRLDRKLFSVGSQFSVGDLYAEDSSLYSNVNVGNLFFGFRKVAANLIWLQVDKFWHSGQIHRMIPSMKTTVALDPNFVDAYLLGAWHMSYNITAQLPVTPPDARKWNDRYKAFVGKREEFYYLGADFLKDGINKNPRDYRLYFDVGYAIYYQKIEDYKNAVLYLAAAVRHPHERWVPRMLNLALEKNHQFADAIAGWERYLLDYPDNSVAPRRIIINRGLLHEQNGDRLTARVAELKEEKRIDEADGLRAQAKEEYGKARAIWDELAFGTEDPFAEARLLRLNAVDNVARGRYYEAITELQEARWKSLQHFDEFSDTIMDIKEIAGMQLSLSEKMQRDRQLKEQELLARTPAAQ